MDDVTGLVDLGAFLRARRALLDPAELGLPPVANQRRVPGLRREEAAQLAGISVDYYTRLEQGRARHVSDSVLGALARGLGLDPDETAYVHNLAAPRRAAVRPVRQHVRPMLQRLLDAMGTPAVVYGRYAEILAWNAVGGVLYLDGDATVERNAARSLFLDPGRREVFPDYDAVAGDLVANLRAEAGRHPGDPHLAQLVGDLSVRSETFARLWAGQTVREKAHGRKRVRHPLVGELDLRYEALRLPDDPDQVVMAYTAEPGSPSEQGLALLASWVATPPADRAHRDDEPAAQRPGLPSAG
jgi:transcriptional regulator with XRE-family HTH domain